MCVEIILGSVNRNKTYFSHLFWNSIFAHKQCQNVGAGRVSWWVIVRGQWPEVLASLTRLRLLHTLIDDVQTSLLQVNYQTSLLHDHRKEIYYIYIYICIYITTALRYQLKYMIKLAYLAFSFLTPSVFVCLGWSCDRWHQSFINWNQKPIKHPSLLPNMALLIINSFWRRTGSIFRSHLL